MLPQVFDDSATELYGRNNFRQTFRFKGIERVLCIFAATAVGTPEWEEALIQVLGKIICAFRLGRKKLQNGAVCKPVVYICSLVYMVL